MRYAIIVLALLGVLASPRPAAALDGNRFLNVCKVDRLACRYYVQGWYEAWATVVIYPGGATEIPTKLGVCIPNQVSVGQAEKVLLKYLRDNPEKLHKGMIELTLFAMQEAFPCR